MMECAVCGQERGINALAPFQSRDGDVLHVCIHLGECLASIEAELPEQSAEAPPNAFEATRIRAYRLADLTGRDRPVIGEPQISIHEGGATWHWPAEG